MSKIQTTKPEHLRTLVDRLDAEQAGRVLGVSNVSIYKYLNTDAAPVTVERLAKHEVSVREVKLPALRNGELIICRVPEHHKEAFFIFCKGMDVKVTRIKDL